MQVYPPTKKGFPLRIEVDASQAGLTLGTINVYIKDVAQISFEQTIDAQRDSQILGKKKGKK